MSEVHPYSKVDGLDPRYKRVNFGATLADFSEVHSLDSRYECVNFGATCGTDRNARLQPDAG